ncbi:hypothetical protein U6A24_12900 [Aquimarina gracilis]|uniref:Magnesium citrate secondary transporter n=1 Tax=Aquimarina gracilis TaxID=874422 RepID=A0ABU5ZWZ4_9FLAO|nr:hypothetical protein [Aquimarina gracilis]MEB3346368.1 hypothetical protein [Aquimarina gracilis]
MHLLVSYIRQWYFPVFTVIATVIYGMQQLGFTLTAILQNYTNDFLCMPIVFYVCQYVVRFIKSDDHVQLPISLLFVVTLLYSWYFEWYLPLCHNRYTADPIDVVLYFAGMLFFYGIEYRRSARFD